jgi:hypothetical protein
MLIYTSSLANKGSLAESFRTMEEALEWFAHQSYNKLPTLPVRATYIPMAGDWSQVFDAEDILIGWITVKSL